MTPRQALRWIEKHGVVLQSAKGQVPNLADHVAGEEIRGSWWGHPKSQEIFVVAESVCDSGDVLICRLVNDKVTFVHRRLWPALVKLAERFDRRQLAFVRSVHTDGGHHVREETSFPDWVPAEVRRAAKQLSVQEAETALGMLIAPPASAGSGSASTSRRKSPRRNA